MNKALDRIRVQPFATWLGLATLATSIQFFIDPGAAVRTPIGMTLHPWDSIWFAGYGVAGVMVLLGLLRIRPRIEAAGLVFLAGSVAIQILAQAAVLGRAAIVSEFVAAGVGAACLVRALTLLSGEDVIIVEAFDIDDQPTPGNIPEGRYPKESDDPAEGDDAK